jgi:hypothetical protein
MDASHRGVRRAMLAAWPYVMIGSFWSALAARFDAERGLPTC